ncbi:MAG: gamma-glutamyltransferase [Hyphomicrobiales bacterium]|nr:gamma-glutamyltransferase [Hyphomicrobiales bacterium]
MNRKGIIAAGHPQTCRAAATILDEGGNAFDAALAGLCAACVVEPVLASLGGGGFLVARPEDGRRRVVVYDFFTQTPRLKRSERDVDFRAVMADFGPTRQEFHVGLGAMATPGIVRGLFAAHRDLGRMPMRNLVQPAVSLAREGAALNAAQAKIIEVVGAILKASPVTEELFRSRQADRGFLREGERLAMPDLADVLETLAIEGEDLFYRGEIGQRLAQDCTTLGGHITIDDLACYRVIQRHPLKISVFGAQAFLNPPPSFGGLLIAFALQLYHSLAPERHSGRTVEDVLRLINVMHAACRVRADISVDGDDRSHEHILRAQLIGRYRDEIAARPLVTRGTTHISVIDREGSAASLTVSNGEGSAYVIPGTGIIMNNMLGEADINPGGFHRWPPDMRMASMMAPSLVIDPDDGLIALGSGGSNRIRSAILQVILNVLGFRMSPDAAVAAPRAHVEDKCVSLEAGFSKDVVEQVQRSWPNLDAWDHKSMFFGGVHVARRSWAGQVDGAGDTRRGGAVEIV